jgi:predicted site-specific integrase-resolvase
MVRMSRKLVGIQEAAAFLGVATQTLRRWEREGRLIPDERTLGGRRRYDLSRLQAEPFRSPRTGRRTVAYARVAHDSRDDLARQAQSLELYCARQAWPYEIITDVGSGMNYHRAGLKRVLDGILGGEVGRLVITHKDRLLRFGTELVFGICEARRVEVVILNQDDDTAFEDELASDVLDMVAVFSARLYGSRSDRSQALLDGVRQAVADSRTG